MKILLIDSNEPINNRNIKIINSLSKKSDIEIILASWKRNSNVNECSYNVSRKYLFNKESKLGNRLKKLSNLFSYYSFLKKLNSKEKPDVIIASHYDILFLASFFKQKKQYLIYENLDIPTSYNNYVLKVLQKVEKYSLSKTDYIIHASRFYPELYSFFKKNQQVLENLPNLEEKQIEKDNTKNNKIVISFIGGIRYIEILMKLVDESIKFDNLEIRLHGDGHESDKLKSYIASKGLEDKITMTGKYEYLSIAELYLDSDFIWAVYPNNDHNVKYAISNKFHESIFFNVPSIYSSKTKLGDFVERNKIGITVDSNINENIYGVLKEISEGKIDLIQLNSNISRFKKQDLNTWESGVEELYDWIKKKVNR